MELKVKKWRRGDTLSLIFIKAWTISSTKLMVAGRSCWYYGFLHHPVVSAPSSEASEAWLRIAILFQV